MYFTITITLLLVLLLCNGILLVRSALYQNEISKACPNGKIFQYLKDSARGECTELSICLITYKSPDTDVAPNPGQ
eukprot:Pgem_evm1s15125